MYQTGLDQAAALLQSLVLNHAFEDGNKWTAIMSCLYFLERCGYWQDITLLTDKESRELEELVLIVATRGTHLNTTVTVNRLAWCWRGLVGSGGVKDRAEAVPDTGAAPVLVAAGGGETPRRGRAAPGPPGAQQRDPRPGPHLTSAEPSVAAR